MLEGAFATFCKGSVYNEIPDTYDGRHDALGRQGFEAEIRSVVTRFEERGHFGDFTVRV
jgi:hypothetical protein